MAAQANEWLEASDLQFLIQQLMGCIMCISAHLSGELCSGSPNPKLTLGPDSPLVFRCPFSIRGPPTGVP